MMIVL